MAVTCAVIQDVCRTGTTGTKDYTSSGFGTPDAAVIIMSGAYSGGNPRATAFMGVGFFDGTNQCMSSSQSADNLGTTNTTRGHSNDDCIGLVTNSKTWVVKATGSFITDGIQLNYSAVPASNAVYLTIYLFKGTTNAKAFSQQLTTTGVNDITTIGFKPHLTFLFGIGSSADPSTDPTADHALFSFGAVHNNSSDVVTQGYVAFGSEDALSSATVSCSIARNDCCVGQLHSDTQTWKGVAEDFDANGFSIDTGADSPGNDYIFGLALQFDSADDCYVGVVDTQTSATTKDYTGPGWQPLGLLLGQTNCTAVNTVTGEGSIALGIADGTDEYSIGMADEDAAATSDTQSDADLSNVASLYWDTGASTSYIAALNSWLSTGFQLSFSDADATARKMLAIAIKDTAAAGGAAPTGTIYGPLFGPFGGPI